MRKRVLPFTALMLDDDEIDCVLLGLQLVRQSSDEDVAESAASALAKFEALLPPVDQPSAPKPRSVKSERAELTHLATAEAAIAVEQKLLLHYVDRKGARSKRTVWPVFIEADEGFAAWCETRRDFRHFRFDRIVSLSQLSERVPTRLRVLLADWRRSEEMNEGY